MVELSKHFPYPVIRLHQKAVLDTLEKELENYDVFCINAPTAAGKSAVARTLINSLHSVSVITPTNCEEWKRPCMATRNKLLNFCKGCQCGKDKSQALFRKGPGIYNYHSYLAHKLYRDALVVDEAHNLLPMIRDRLAIRMWKHDLKYPDNMYRPDQVLQWISRNGSMVKEL